LCPPSFCIDSDYENARGDGGDVLKIENFLFVGDSGRTNKAAHVKKIISFSTEK
jgi:N-dimethylarginine dimethylaminohydrolase